MLNVLSQSDAHQLRTLVEEAGYTEPNLRKHLGAPELPSRHLRNLPRLLDRTAAPLAVNILLRWFWLGIPQQAGEFTSLLPEPLLQLLLAAGLVERHGDTYTPQAMLLPVDKFLVASDHPSAIENQQAEMVLWPNPTSKFLGRFAIRRHSRATLDLGTGSGILSLGAAPHSDQVVATDITERAALFARFNARLNDVENIEVLVGDCFAPIAGRTFDLILSNPPFFITPQTDFVFCENEMELDSLCRRLVKEAPAHLNEGGYFEMLCEWAQIEGQNWEDRVAEWLEGTGCDGWVMKGLTQDPAEYAQHRIKEIMQEPEKDDELFHGYMNYYRQRGVQAIHDGLLVMRKRAGKNWVRIEEVPKTPTGELGELILSTFAAHDLLYSLEDDAALLAIRPALAPHVRLEQICIQGGGQWRAESLTLRLVSGFPFHLTVQPLVAEFLATCDGSRTAAESIQTFAGQISAPADQVERECIAMIRKLIERGFMIVQQ